MECYCWSSGPFYPLNKVLLSNSNTLASWSDHVKIIIVSIYCIKLLNVTLHMDSDGFLASYDMYLCSPQCFVYLNRELYIYFLLLLLGREEANEMIHEIPPASINQHFKSMVPKPCAIF